MDDGADLLGVVGGDGTQALVAEVAAESGLPFVVIPAGTRNHFAMDLGRTVRTLRRRWRPPRTAWSCAWISGSQASGCSSTACRSVPMPPWCRTRPVPGIAGPPRGSGTGGKRRAAHCGPAG
ncbi:diacylglycerol kinase family protein [Streptomyces sp. NPDC056638]|uniref:diacylglycerol kinase family protein n=1 Tax=Streptomyces sp. NPDC056638 TaxID=3345887 RepID=UPI0036AC11A9